MKPTAKRSPEHYAEYEKIETAFKARGITLRRVTGQRNKLTGTTLPNMPVSAEDVDSVARRLEEELKGVDVEEIAANVRKEINGKIAEEHPNYPPDNNASATPRSRRCKRRRTAAAILRHPSPPNGA